MIGVVLVTLFLPIAIAFLLIKRTWPPRRQDGPPLTLSLAIGVGLGIGSGTFFLSLVLFNGSPSGTLSLEVGLLLLALTWWIFRRQRRTSSAVSFTAEPWHPLHWLAVIGMAEGGVAVLATFVLNSMASPHGEWDAWAIWNLRARFLFRGRPDWHTAFSQHLAWSHPDYPPLLPSAIARSWAFIGADPTIVPITVALLFSAATVGLLYSSLWWLRSRSQGSSRHCAC